MQIERFPIHTSEPGESRFGISPKALDFINMIFVMNKLILSIIYTYFGYYTLGDIQALTITYAIVAPDLIVIIT